MEGADKKALSQLIKEILAEYDKQGKLIFDTKAPNSYIRFQTKEMSEILPNMSKSGSWGHGFRYLFWLGEHETTAHKFKACFEIGGWDLDEHSIPIISKIIKLKKPGDTKLKFRYKRIYTKVYEYTPDTATQVIKYAIDDLISWQYQFLKKI